MSDLEKIKQLRQSTGAGFKDCSAAIKESEGDLNKASEILRIKGISKASKKMSRDAKEGVVALSGDQNKTSVIEVNCETDFVAKNEDFINFVKELSDINNSVNSDIDKLNKSIMKNKKTVEENFVSMIAKIGEKITLGRVKTLNHENSKNYYYLHTVVKDNLSKIAVIASINTKEKSEKIDLFGKQLSMHIAASNPISVNPEEIKKEILDKEQELVTEELKNSGKPENIAKKISSGKMNKFKEDNSLMTQQWVMEPKKKVKNIIEELGFKDLKIVDFYRIKIGD
jgi:elongation factor Ts